MKSVFFVLVCIVLCSFSSLTARAFEPNISTADYLSGDTHVSVSHNWTQDTQRETSKARPSTTTAHETTLTISRKITPSVRAGIDFDYRDQLQESDYLLPGFTEPGRLGRKKYEAGAFAIISHHGFSITPSARIGFDDYELDRPDVLTGLTGRSKTRGFHSGGNLEVSYLMPLSSWLYLRPIADIDYSYLTANAFTETGAGPNNVAFERVVDERTVAQMGFGLASVLPIAENIWLAPFIQARYRHNFNSDPITTDAALASGFLDLGEVELSTSQGPDGVILNSGFFLKAGPNLEIRAAYEGEYFPSSTAHTLSGRLKLAF
jgi:hypothetical protein